MNIVLIGMPGSSKTTTGRELAKFLSMNFIDSDAEIIRLTGMEISEYFARFGEDCFREKEEEVIQKLSGYDSFVISCGGGVVVREQNIAYLKKNGFVVFLNSSLEALSIRVNRHNGRPLLEGDVKEKLSILFDKRFKLYNGFADFVIDNSSLTVMQTVERIADKFSKI